MYSVIDFVKLVFPECKIYPYQQRLIDMLEKENFKLDDQVHFTVSKASGRSIKFSTVEGKIIELRDEHAIVLAKRQKKYKIKYTSLRKFGEQSHLTDIFTPKKENESDN